MADLIAKKLGKKYFRGKAENAFQSEDLYFANETVVTRSGNTKVKKVKRAPPPGLTKEEEQLLKRVKRRAWFLDMGLINCCGIRFGFSALVGIIPVLGDAIDFLMAYMVYSMCCEADLSSSTKASMFTNMIIDGVIGITPLLGDIADGLYKCNVRNAALLEKELRQRGEARISARREEANRYHLAEQHEVARHGGPPPGYASTQAPQKPPLAATRDQSRGGWTSWFGGRRDRDVEAAEDVGPSLPPRDGNSRSMRI